MNAQIINFPDPKFKTKLLSSSANDLNGNQTVIDVNGDSNIDMAEAASISELRLSNQCCPESYKYSDITGIENFINLKKLDCSYNLVVSVTISALTQLQVINFSHNSLTVLPLMNLPLLTEIDCSFNSISEIHLQQFPNLLKINCGWNQIVDLNLSNLPNLTWFQCNNNNISNLNLSGLSSILRLLCNNNTIANLDLSMVNSLEQLSCRSNLLTSLDVSALINLKKLDFGDNMITSISLTGVPELESLVCFSNQLSSLNLAGLNNLKQLVCYESGLTVLDLSTVPNLEELVCTDNSLMNLDVNNLTKLITLWCGGNNLSTLNVSGLTHLTQLFCNDNQLTTLIIEDLPALSYLYCSVNQLTTLDLSTATGLAQLNVESNQLQSLFIKNGSMESNGIYLTNNPTLQYICVDQDQLTTVQTIVSQLGYSGCVINTYCSFVPGGVFYNITGNNRFDANGNGCTSDDIALPNVGYTISNNTTAGTIISNESGNYSIPVQSGYHILTPFLENPSYYTISPSSATIIFPSMGNEFNQDFCFLPNGIHNDLEIVIIPLNNIRPGFDSSYKIIYKNKGNQLQSGTISFAFNDAVLDLVNSIPTASSQVINYLNWNFSDLQPFETREITVTLNANSPSEIPPVNGGDILNYSVSINSSLTDETPTDNSFSLNQTVVNSFDPNDKTCLEGNTITPEMVGKEVHYMIRFENTGTANAENIVVKDMIDTAKFDITSLVPLDGSHPFITRISEYE